MHNSWGFPSVNIKAVWLYGSLYIFIKVEDPQSKTYCHMVCKHRYINALVYRLHTFVFLLCAMQHVWFTSILCATSTIIILPYSLQTLLHQCSSVRTKHFCVFVVCNAACMITGILCATSTIMICKPNALISFLPDIIAWKDTWIRIVMSQLGRLVAGCCRSKPVCVIVLLWSYNHLLLVCWIRDITAYVNIL